MDGNRIRVVSIMEAQFVTGPAKNLLEFAVRARQAPEGLPAVELSVVTYHRGNATLPADNPFIAAAERAGIPVDVIQERGAFDRSIVPQITAALERRRPDIVQTHNSKSHFLMRYSGLAKKYPWIAFHHGYTSTDMKMRLYHELDRWSLPASSHLLTVCGPFRQQLEQRGIGRARITIQHNAINPFSPVPDEQIAAIRNELQLPEAAPIIVMISRLSHEKGHVDFLHALAELQQRGTAFHAVIVGEGPERTAIEATWDRLHLQNAVTLAGHRNDVKPYFRLATLFAMPSHSEGSPNALLEAMAARLPVVASAVGGIPEIVTSDEIGVLVPPRNPRLLADALEGLLRDPERARQMAERAEASTARFTYEAYHRGLTEMYSGVLNRTAERR